MDRRTCSIDECDATPVARGWCFVHYRKWLAHGDANFKKPTLEERLWPRIDKSGEHWIWTGGCIGTGYGTISVAGVDTPVHRLVYELEVGPIPDGLVLDHLCRVRRCCKPEHLEPVTFRENILRGESVIAHRARRNGSHV